MWVLKIISFLSLTYKTENKTSYNFVNVDYIFENSQEDIKICQLNFLIRMR